jgi:hypothetical protein
MTLTPTQATVLRFLNKSSTWYRLSIIGMAIWETSDPETRKRNPSPQGLALLASKPIYHLENAQLVRYHSENYDRGHFITEAGRVALATYESEQEMK